LALTVVGGLTGGLGAAAQTVETAASAPTAQVQAVPAQTAQAAPAQTAPAAPNSAPPRILDEVKGGLVAHDVGIGGHHREDGVDVNLEVLFASPDIFKYILKPRPLFGIDINSKGLTSSYYLGLAWGGVFYEPGWGRGDGFFGYFTFGPAVHDGKLDTTDPNRKSLGSRVLFREAIDLGYRFNDTVSFAAFMDHISNANLANRNEGLTNFGGRVGFRF
jgi:lipid A 3-O-deacylase